MTLICSIFLGIVLKLSNSSSNLPHPSNFSGFIDAVKSTEIPHRGGAKNAPENTMAAIYNAAKLGYKAIEIDIQFTSDDIPVVIHDETLERTTNGTGLVSNATLEQIKTLSASYHFDDVADCTVPTLEEVIEFAIHKDIILLLDVKGGSHCRKISNTVTLIKEKYPSFLYNFAIISFFPDILATMRYDHPNVITGFTRRHDHFQISALRYGYTSPLLQSLLYACDKIYDFVMFYVFVPIWDINMLEIRKEDVSEDYVRSVAPRPLLVWTVNEPVEKAFFKSLGCAVMTDVIGEMKGDKGS